MSTKQQQTSIDERKQPSTALAYARRHPALTVIGAAAVGLLGGVELAAGVLIGAGVAAFARASGPQLSKQAIEEEAHGLKERGRQLMSHVPDDLKQRARAVMQAARGQRQPS